MGLKSTMTEFEMRQYVNEKLGFEVEFLIEFATRELGYNASLIQNENGEEYLFTK